MLCCNIGNLDELKINTMPPTQNGQFRPPPAPTSPIPQLPTAPHPSQSKVSPPSSLATNTFSVASANPASFHSSLPPLFPVTPRIIWPVMNRSLDDELENEVRMSYSMSMTSRPIVISMANVLRKHGSSPNIKCDLNAHYLQSLPLKHNDGISCSI